MGNVEPLIKNCTVTVATDQKDGKKILCFGDHSATMDVFVTGGTLFNCDKEKDNESDN